MMSLKVAHELGFGAAMLCGVLGLLLGGALPPACWLILLVVPLSAWQSLHERPLSVRAGGVVGLICLAYAATMLLGGGDGAALLGACVFLLGMLAARLLTRSYPSHDLQALVLSLLLMFAGTLLHQAFTYALVLIAYTVAATWALLTRQLVSGCTEAYFRHGNRAELTASLARRDVVTVRFGLTVAALAWCILLATGVLFVLFPRVGLGGMRFAPQTGLLGDSISLSGPPRAQGSDQVVVRLRGLSAQAADAGLYLRGRIYDGLRNDGFRREPTLARVRPSQMVQRVVGAPLSYQLEIQSVDGDRLLALGPVLHAERPGDLFGAVAGQEVAVQAPSSELVALEPMQGPTRLNLVGYNVPLRLQSYGQGDDALEVTDAPFRQHFLSLPPNLDPNVVALAQRIVGTTPRFGDRALKLRQFLLQNFAYTLQQPNAHKADPLASFLFEDRRGHCEYFAIAYAVLLRAVGVPSRVVGGYQGGAWDAADATVLFSGRNAHAWVEWYLPHQGWVVDDATPPSDVAPLSAYAQWLEQMRAVWENTIMEFGLTDQLALLKHVGGGLGGALGPTGGLRQIWSGRKTAPGPLVTLLGALAAVALTAALALGRLARSRRGPRLSRALLAAFERLGGAPVAPASGYTDLLADVRRQRLIASAADDRLLEEATALYCRYRYGSEVAPPQVGRLCRRLARLRPRT
jgi:hypothetical protein